ncbi:MAG: glycoside hydrolase family 3 N-terminal domain-containing protein [Bacteroidota bacterium]
MKYLICLLMPVGLLLSSFDHSSPEFPHPESEGLAWADSVLSSLSLEEKIGQLFMVATFSNKDEKEYQFVEKLVRDDYLGGIIFMQGNPASQLQLVNRYQRLANVPLLIAQDAEWGLSMRLKGVQPFPKNMTLGAITDDSLLYDMGSQMAKELRRVGVGMNFAPVVDVNNNSRNPVINYRSYGENKFNVARKGIMFTRGLQGQGVIACAKHFPGHGDTDTDSHHALPLIKHDLHRLDTLELYPFVKLIQAGVQSLMVAHLQIPSLDPRPDQATTLSRRVVTGLLRDSLDYRGLVITDALNMQGVAKDLSPDEVSLQAFLAGNDILLFPSNIPRSARRIKEAILNEEVTEAELDQRVRRILLAKFRIGLANPSPLSPDQLEEDLNSSEGNILRRKLYHSSLTLAKNQGGMIPLQRLAQRDIAYVQIGGSSNSTFDLTLRKYGDIQRFYLRKNFTTQERNQLLKRLELFNTVIIGMFGMNQRASMNFGIRQSASQFCQELSRQGSETALVLFGNPYALRFFGEEDAVLVAYETAKDAQEGAAMALFGGLPITGRLPVSASDDFQEGMGVIVPEAVRFGFAIPEAKGLDSRVLHRIDSIALHYIDRQAMPGCQVLVVKDRSIVYDKSFGRTEYGRRGTLIDSYQHTYDLASVTKVAATTLCTMDLVEQGRLDLDAPISTYLPELRKSNKAELTPRRLLQHNAGLPGWYPFYKHSYASEETRQLDKQYFSYFPTRSHTDQIAPALYTTETLNDSVWKWIRDLPVRNTTRVRYSDIGMILMGEVIHAITGKPLNEYARENFYQHLGMNQTYFKPHIYGDPTFCPPTEADTFWRHTVIQGFVHDPSAAILGGVAGHAGLFSNVYDLAKVMMMIKNGGSFGGEYYLRKGTIGYFTKKHLVNSRKGLGWDKPELNPRKRNPSPTSSYASPATYGHTGFTGTCVWIDPVQDLIFIFLSNRTFPYASNRLLLRENVRILLMDQVYEALYSFQQNLLAE